MSGIKGPAPPSDRDDEGEGPNADAKSASESDLEFTDEEIRNLWAVLAALGLVLGGALALAFGVITPSPMTGELFNFSEHTPDSNQSSDGIVQPLTLDANITDINDSGAVTFDNPDIPPNRLEDIRLVGYTARETALYERSNKSCWHDVEAEAQPAIEEALVGQRVLVFTNTSIEGYSLYGFDSGDNVVVPLLEQGYALYTRDSDPELQKASAAGRGHGVWNCVEETP